MIVYIFYVSFVDLKSFKFFILLELKEYVKKLEFGFDNLRCEFVRECVMCFKVEYGEFILNDVFKMVSKLICVEVFELVDV